MGQLSSLNMSDTPFNILVLDGGGSKGVYSLGILHELRLRLNTPLHKHFNLIYGTSTGSIIGSLLALGKDVPEIKKLYFDKIPEIMSQRTRRGRSKKLSALADAEYGNCAFADFKTDVGIVALNFNDQRPLIFKSNISQAHGMKQSFVPGFGVSISNAVQASCSAYPVFIKKIIKTSNQGTITAVDGGFIANNATLFALIDAVQAFGIPRERIRVVSIGTGKFVEKPINGFMNILRRFKLMRFAERIMISSSTTNETLSKLIYSDIQILRINNTYNQPEYGTNMVESDESKLETLYRLGRNSYAEQEDRVNEIIS